MAKQEGFNKGDFNQISEYIADEYSSRKAKRKDLENDWKEIDRQLSMTPDLSMRLVNGKEDPNRAWMPAMELPLQAQTLEVLTADARRLLAPDTGPWFEAHAMMTDDYLEKNDLQTMITGDKNEVPSTIDQDNIDKLTQGVVSYWHNQYDFWGNIDKINAEAFTYGMGLGRARLVTKRVFIQTARGVRKLDQQMPVLFPVSIKNNYLDDREYSVMNEGQMIGPSTISYKKQSIEDLRMAAKKGSPDPEDPNGGWMPANLKGIEGKDGAVTVLEYEGDLIVSRKTTDSIFIPNYICTIVLDGGKRQVIRMRRRGFETSSDILFPYHHESIENPYATSPLMKGYPIQKAATDALNRLIMIAALNGLPPVSYTTDDPYFAQSGGPKIYPTAQWPTSGDITVHQIGDPVAMQSIYAMLLQQYADVTGVQSPRLGQQTVSHTTAYAKQQELSQGTIRTVDYVRNCLKGPLNKWLDLSYKMGRSVWVDAPVYIDSYGGFVDITKKILPEDVIFEANGAGGPSEEQVKLSNRASSLNMAVQLEQARAQMMQLGIEDKTVIDYAKAIEQTLRQGGWTDINAIIRLNP